MDTLLKDLRTIFKGEITTDEEVLREFSHDASIYEMTPEAVLAPKDTADIKHLVHFVNEHKHAYPTLSITPRSAGTDMSGAAIGNSLTVDMTKHFNTIHSASSTMLHTQPGVHIRDIDPLLLEHNAMLGCIPASRALNTIGGMVGNNSAGEQSLRYGNTDKSVRELKAVMADGNEYTFKPINKKELMIKIAQNDFEGNLYKNVYELIESHYDVIKNARPKVHKNSMGYNLWTTWDRDTGIFDMAQLLTGSQGTLGVVTDIKIATVPKAKHSGLLLAYLTNLSHLGEIIPLVMGHHPATFEGFDDVTFNLGVKYFNTFRKQLGAKEYLKQQATLLGSVAKFKGHLPNIVLMVEFEADTYREVNDKIVALKDDLDAHRFKIRTDIEGNEEASKPFWQIRRASLMLLRQRIKDKYASSFMDDLAVQPQYVPEFFPKIRKIIRKYKLPATIAGHFGDGNFHIIPLMDITNPEEQLKLEPAMRELVPIVLQYGGTLAGEHNDGMVRGPWLPAMFGDEVYDIFKQTKAIFDPRFIFNPHKKTDATWDFSMQNVRRNRLRNFYK
jgi:FAD/FMN-containing dehydrogenase